MREAIVDKGRDEFIVGATDAILCRHHGTTEQRGAEIPVTTLGILYIASYCINERPQRTILLHLI